MSAFKRIYGARCNKEDQGRQAMLALAGLVQCEGCPPGVLVPKGGPYDGMCPGHRHQTEFRYGLQGGVSHI